MQETPRTESRANPGLQYSSDITHLCELYAGRLCKSDKFT